MSGRRSNICAMCSLIIPAWKRCSKGWRLHSRDLLPQGTDGNSSERAGICHPMERESATADRSEVTFDRIDGAEMEFAAQDRDIEELRSLLHSIQLPFVNQSFQSDASADPSPPPLSVPFGKKERRPTDTGVGEERQSVASESSLKALSTSRRLSHR